MTKTLTEQWREGTLSEGWYYLKVKSELANYPVIAECVINYSSLKPYSDFYEYADSHIEEVLAPVLPYRVLYDKDQGIFPVLNIVLRNIEREQCRRKLTDLELSIKSQVKGVLAFNGLVSNTDESAQKMHILDNELKDMAFKNDALAMENGRLQDKLKIATKALKETKKKLLHVELSGLDGDNRQKMYDLMFEDGVIDKALKEMEGVK